MSAFRGLFGDSVSSLVFARIGGYNSVAWESCSEDYYIEDNWRSMV